MKLPWSLLAVIAVASLASWGWRSHVAAQDARQMAALVKPGDIRMISSETCGWCTVARRWFTDEGIPFEECFLERDAQCRAAYVARGGRGTPTLVVHGQTVIGFDRARMLEVLHDKAEPSRQR